MSTRQYTTRRMSIIEALVDKIKEVDGTGDFNSNLYNNVSPRLMFWDEVSDFPSIHLSAGTETREYQGGGYKDRFLNVTIRVYVNEEDAPLALDKILEDIETVLEENSCLTYLDKKGTPQKTQQITIVSIETDEGVLEPYGIGEMLIEVRY